jgi:sugar phosphate isomerase/epimerase
LLSRVQVNVPFQQLMHQYLERFLHYGVNPEIGVNAQVLDEWDEVSLREAASRFAEKGRRITLHGPFMDLAPGSGDVRIRQVSSRRFHRTMDLVSLLHPESVVFHAGYDKRHYHAHREQWLADSIATWEPLTRRAEKLGVVIYLENVYEDTPEMIAAVLKAISSENLRFCLDVGHMNAFAVAPLTDWLATLGSHLGEVHLHDNDGGSDAHGPIGSGTVPFQELFRYLSAGDRNPVLTLEPHEEASLWSSLRSLETLWPWKEW